MVSKNYMGNAAVHNSTEFLPVNDILRPDGLSFTASSVRQSIDCVEHLTDLRSLTAINAKLGSNETARLDSTGLDETMFMITNWSSVLDIPKFDFGIGPPSIIRAGVAPISNVGILFPGSQQPDPDAYDLMLCLTEQEQDLLSKYVLWRW